MFTQKSSAPGAPNATQKLHSIHVLPNGRNFVGKVEVGRNKYQFTFTPQSAVSANWKLVLTGAVKVKAPGAQERLASGVSATLLATQGSVTHPSSLSRQFSASLKPPQAAPSSQLPLTE